MCKQPINPSTISEDEFDKFLDDNAEIVHSLAESNYTITKDDEWNDPAYNYENFVAKKEADQYNE